VCLCVTYAVIVYQILTIFRLQQLDVEDESLWEFETVRGRSFLPAFDRDSSPPDTEDNTVPNQSTIRPPPSTTLPSSLRLLFEDEVAPQSDSFRLPTFPSHRNTPSPPTLLSQSISPSLARDKTAMKLTLDGSGDDLPAKQPNFAFPPRMTVRSRSKLSSNVPSSDDEASSDDSKVPPFGQGAPLFSRHTTEGSEPSVNAVRNTSTYRDVRSARGPPDIKIPRPSDVDNPPFDLTSPTTTGLSSSSPDISIPGASSFKRPANRKRSQSSAEGLTSRGGFTGRRDLNLASPAAFQFPPNLKVWSPSPPAVSPLQLQKTHNLISPTHASASSPVISPSAHQTAYSLDTSAFGVQPRRYPAPGQHLPSSIARTRSATALPETTPPETGSGKAGTSINRQASTRSILQDGPPLVPPVKPFARPGRDRSCSDSSVSVQTTNFGLPGLKDVLKVLFVIC
jgi:protein-serine/threonine kinase